MKCSKVKIYFGFLLILAFCMSMLPNVFKETSFLSVEFGVLKASAFQQGDIFEQGDIFVLGSNNRVFEIVSVKDNSFVLVSNRVIGTRYFDVNGGGWGNSSIQSYLNEDFYNEFLEVERGVIKEVDGDKVRLLTKEQSEQWFINAPVKFDSAGRASAYWLNTSYEFQNTHAQEDGDSKYYKYVTASGDIAGAVVNQFKKGIVPVIEFDEGELSNIELFGTGELCEPYRFTQIDRLKTPENISIENLIYGEARILKWDGDEHAIEGYEIEMKKTETETDKSVIFKTKGAEGSLVISGKYFKAPDLKSNDHFREFRIKAKRTYEREESEWSSWKKFKIKRAMPFVRLNDTSPIIKVEGDALFRLNYRTNSDGDKEFTSTNDDVATVTNEGMVTIESDGITEFGFYVKESNKFKGSEPVSVKLIVYKEGELGGAQEGNRVSFGTPTFNTAQRLSWDVISGVGEYEVQIRRDDGNWANDGYGIHSGNSLTVPASEFDEIGKAIQFRVRESSSDNDWRYSSRRTVRGRATSIELDDEDAIDDLTAIYDEDSFDKVFLLSAWELGEYVLGNSALGVSYSKKPSQATVVRYENSPSDWRLRNRLTTEDNWSYWLRSRSPTREDRVAVVSNTYVIDHNQAFSGTVGVVPVLRINAETALENLILTPASETGGVFILD